MLEDMLETVIDKKKFLSLEKYIDFASYFLEYIEENKYDTIVSSRDPKYKFYQYDSDVEYRIARPFNAELLYSIEEFEIYKHDFIDILNKLKKDKDKASITDRNVINKSIYTIQQSIGFGLDALPNSNKARKIAGDLFENLINLVFQEIGFYSSSRNIKVSLSSPKTYVGKQAPSNVMSFQQDLVIHKDVSQTDLVIGSVKITSKDRLSKIFLDKYLFNKLSRKDHPHIAIFLHDIQRNTERSKKYAGKYSVASTFLPGTFKGLSLELIELDGVYYLDPPRHVQNNPFIEKRIFSFDKLICEDIWKIV